MLYWALVFLVVAIIAGALGFGGIAGTSAGIAQILFFVFLAFLAISLLAGLFRRAGGCLQMLETAPLNRFPVSAGLCFSGGAVRRTSDEGHRSPQPLRQPASGVGTDRDDDIEEN